MQAADQGAELLRSGGVVGPEAGEILHNVASYVDDGYFEGLDLFLEGVRDAVGGDGDGVGERSGAGEGEGEDGEEVGELHFWWWVGDGFGWMCCV